MRNLFINWPVASTYQKRLKKTKIILNCTLDAPTVRSIPDEGFLEVKKGEYVDIGCETTGTPTPIVKWRKNVSV